MKKIFVVASELAIITGHNKYENIQKAIDSVLNRSDIIKIYIPKSKVEETLLNLKDKDFIKIKKELNLSDDTSLKEVENVIKKQVMGKSLDSNLSEDQSKEKLNEVLKSILGLKNGLDNQMMIFNSIKINLRKVKLSLNPKCKNKC